MTEKKLSRRDAMKVLGAAVGATALATLPPEWSKPELGAGTLPAHAQTSVCVDYAVFLEVIEGQVGVGPLGPGTPPPDEVTGNGGPGSTLAWNCQSGCLGIRIFMFGGASAIVALDKIGIPYEFEMDTTLPSWDILIEMETGEIALNGNGTAGACDWPILDRSIEPETGSFWQE